MVGILPSGLNSRPCILRWHARAAPHDTNASSSELRRRMSDHQFMLLSTWTLAVCTKRRARPDIFISAQICAGYGKCRSVLIFGLDLTSLVGWQFRV